MELQERSQVEEASPLRASHSGILPVRPYVISLICCCKKQTTTTLKNKKFENPLYKKKISTKMISRKSLGIEQPISLTCKSNWMKSSRMRMSRLSYEIMRLSCIIMRFSIILALELLARCTSVKI